MPRLHPEQDILTAIRPTLAGERRVVTSAHHAEVHGLKNATANNEQKLGAHLLRLEKLFSRGEKTVDKIWQSAINELLISSEALEAMDDGGDAFWRSQKKALRDSGHGSLELDKPNILSQYRNIQENSLTPWKDFLANEGSDLPLWFKFYAWDGMSSMGLIDRERKTFMKRSGATVAPYPPFDKQALSMVFDTIVERSNTGKKLQPIEFNKLYAKALFEVKGVIPTPDDPADIEGEWIQYGKENKAELMSAATVTPWCIAQRWAADMYVDRDNDFLFFHLRNKATGELSPTACASIRAAEGTVLEVNGLLDRQSLEPSLTAVVDDKLSQLTHADEYRRKMKDNNRLKALDAIYQKNERLFTLEELVEIEQLQYPRGNLDDPRTSDFINSFNNHPEEYAAVLGEKAQYLFRENSYWEEISDDIQLVRQAIAIMGPEYVSIHTGCTIGYNDHRAGAMALELMKAGLGIDVALDKMSDSERCTTVLEMVDLYYYAFRSDEERAAGWQAIQKYCQDNGLLEKSLRMTDMGAKYFDALTELGVQLDVNEVVEDLLIYNNLNTQQVLRLLANGANPDILFTKVQRNPRRACETLGQFVKKGAHIDTVQFSRTLNDEYVSRYGRRLHEAGVPKRELRRRLGIPWYRRVI